MRTIILSIVIILSIAASLICYSTFPVVGQEFGQALVIPYTETGGKPSSNYSVTVNGKNIATSYYRHGKEGGDDMSYAHFAFAGKVEVVVTVKESVSSYTLSPKSLELKPVVNGNTLRFTLTEPRKLLLRNANKLQENLAIFADHPEEDVPSLKNPKVLKISNYDNNLQKAVDAANKKGGGIVYVSTGTYKGCELKDNVSIYLAPGATITSEINIERASNVKVYGRGVIRNTGAGNTVTVDSSKNVVLKDFVSADGGHGIFRSLNVSVYNVHGFRVSVRNEMMGGNGTSHLSIDNVFLWNTDDATAIGYRHNQEDINVTNSVLGTWKTGSTCKVRVGWKKAEPKQVVDYLRYYTYENLDLLSGERFFSCISTDGGDVHDFYLKNLRYEKNTVQDHVFDISLSNGNWGGSYSAQGGSKRKGMIHDFHFKNIYAEQFGPQESKIKGMDKMHKVYNVTLENLVIEGKIRTDASSAKIMMNNAENVIFKESAPPIVGIKATDMYGSEEGDSVEFTVSRTGSTSQPLTVKYLVHGTSRNGTDYPSLKNSVTIPAGSSAAKIEITPSKDNNSERAETIFISINNLKHTADGYLVGPNYHAQAVIYESGKDSGVARGS